MRRPAICILAALCCPCLPGSVAAEMTGIEKLHAAKTEFRVCASPDNLPFSNRSGKGFENKIAERLAQAAGQLLVYDWWPARRGFIKNTLNRWNCDVVIGVPSGYELTATTHAYYCSQYVIAYRGGEQPPRFIFGGGASTSLRIGVVERTPPLDMLLRQGINPVVYFTDYGYRGNSAGLIMRDLAERKIDVALIWGPIGGYFARRLTVGIDLVPLATGGNPDIRLAFPISMGIRHGDKERLAWLEPLLDQNAPAIEAILTSYGVPLVHDGRDCSVERRETAGRHRRSLRLVAQNAPSGQPNPNPAQQQSGPPAPHVKASATDGKAQIAHCDPSETIDQVKSEFPSSGAQQGGSGSGSTEPPYRVQDNKLGPKAYEGWVRFSAFCERCHGPGGIGSAQAPDLAAAIKSLTKAQFEHIVRCGLTGNVGIGVMPPWGDNPNIAPYVDDLWSYLKARADDAIGPGRPEKLTTLKR
jgi:mxaJ protein